MERSPQFRVALVHTAAELNQIVGIPDIIVFPEGVDVSEIWEASSICDHAVVVGAVRVWEGSTVRMRGVVWYKGQNHIDYLKASTDGRTSLGTNNFKQNPVASFSELGFSIGVIICRDVGDAWVSQELCNKVIALLKCSPHEKLLCIPADMITNDFFREDSLEPSYHGVYVALCNQPQENGQIRTKSFIADMAGEKIYQSDAWPICIDLHDMSP